MPHADGIIASETVLDGNCDLLLVFSIEFVQEIPRGIDNIRIEEPTMEILILEDFFTIDIEAFLHLRPNFSFDFFIRAIFSLFAKQNADT